MYITSLAATIVLATSLQAFDPDTGEVVENANCDQYHTKINGYIDEMRASQTEVKRTDKIKEEIKKAKEKGCPPDPNWGVSAGMYSSKMRANEEEYTYVPSSSSEQGVPMTFDFFGLINSLIGQFTGGSIFPAIKNAAGAVGGSGGSSGGSSAP